MATTATLYSKTTLAGAWTAATSVDVLHVEFALAPKTSSARFVHKYGYLWDSGDSGSGASVVAPVDFRGKWIRIELDDGSTSVDWYGYCPEETALVDRKYTAPDGTANVACGDSEFVAYGFEYLLKNATIESALVDVSGLSFREVKRPLSFNSTSRSRNTQVVGNRAATAVGGVYGFDDTGTSTSQWTARQAINNLLYLYSLKYGVLFSLAGQESWLDQIVEPWGNVDGRSYYDVISDMIKPSRGFSFSIWGTSVYVVSITDTAVGAVIPANDNVVSLTLDESALMVRPRVRHLDNVHYDEIVVRGEPLRVCFTMKYSFGTLAAGWTTAEQTAYQADDDDGRVADKYSKVFCRVVLPSGFANENELGDIQFPQIDETTGLPDWTKKAEFYLPQMVLDKSIPILDTNAAGRQLARPMVWIEYGGKYYNVAKPNTNSIKGATVRVLDDDVGIIVSPRIPHYYGQGQFVGSSSTTATLDSRKLVATVSMYTDERVRVVVSATEAEPGEVTRRKVIDVPDAHVWVLAPGTAKEIAADSLGRIVSAEITRNDTAILQQIAAMAQVWYGRRRAEISVEYSDLIVLNRLGQVVQEISYNGATIPAGTIITAIEYDVAGLRTSFSTEWRDVDLGAVLRPKNGITKEVSRRLRKVEEQLGNVPVDFGGSGSADVSLVVVKISGVHSDYTAGTAEGRMYTGSAWEGFVPDGSPTANVTISIPGIPGNVTTPSYGTWAASPYLLARKLVATWVGASLTHTDDTVYEALGAALLL